MAWATHTCSFKSLRRPRLPPTDLCEVPVLVCSGGRNETPRAGCLAQRTLIFSQLRRRGGHDQGAGRVGAGEGSPLGRRTAAFSLSPTWPRLPRGARALCSLVRTLRPSGQSRTLRTSPPSSQYCLRGPVSRCGLTGLRLHHRGCRAGS